MTARDKFFLGRQHDRPDLKEINDLLKDMGTEWRATRAKSLGLHIWNPSSHECRCPSESGWVTIPDLQQMQVLEQTKGDKK